MTTATPVIIHVMEDQFFIVDFSNDLLKWDGSSFRKVGLGYGGNLWSIWSAISFSSAEEVVVACQLHNFEVRGLVTDLPKEGESGVWEKIQALTQASVAH